LLDADADRADLELPLIKPLPEDRARAHPFAGSGGSWHAMFSQPGRGSNSRRKAA
jgi:hypothetical protein